MRKLFAVFLLLMVLPTICQAASVVSSGTFQNYTSIGRVPDTRTVNGHALNANVTVTAGDVGAVAVNTPITPATKTKLTYDAKGLVTAGTDATTADISDSTDRRYVTDAQLVVVGNTSGTNTGDVTIGTANGLSLVGQALSLQAATDSVPGALTAADHTTFNGKQPAGNYITALTGDVTASGPGSAAATVAKVQGVTVDSTAPTTGDLLRYDGSQWRHVALTSGDIPNNGANTSGSAAGLSGTPSITVSEISTGDVALKWLKLTGTSGATEGSSVNVSHGLTVSKIVGYQSMIRWDGTTSTGSTPGDLTAGYKYYVYLNGANFVIKLDDTSSESILSKDVIILVQYTN